MQGSFKCKALLSFSSFILTIHLHMIKYPSRGQLGPRRGFRECQSNYESALTHVLGQKPSTRGTDYTAVL